MSSNVTKRTLSAGLGVGALALLAPRASADTPFSSFAFPATGAPTARTLPDRLGDLKNVKDFGARGNGSTDDTAAIQAAVDKTGTIYFPPGEYRITKTISIAKIDGQYDLVGARGVTVHGDFNGYLFDTGSVGGDWSLHFTCSKVNMTNRGLGVNSGGVNIRNGFVVKIEDCAFEAWRPITLGNLTCGAVRDCVFRGVTFDGTYSNTGINEKASIAIYSGTACGEIVNCDINGFYEGIRLGGFAHIRQIRIEMCERGIVSGMDEEGNGSPATAMIDGAQLEANNFQIIIFSGSAQIRSVDMLGDTFTVNAPGPSQVGLLLVDQSDGLIMQQVVVEGEYQDAGIKFAAVGDGSPNLHSSVWMSVRVGLSTDPAYLAAYPNAMAWKGMENLDRNQVTFIQCNNP